ncbi:hypothetical protein GW17_00024620 [Ensete ventricosum]|nr:hypothetical protein GW17_00024620 [Ensete ventricosum]
MDQSSPEAAKGEGEDVGSVVSVMDRLYKATANVITSVRRGAINVVEQQEESFSLGKMEKGAGDGGAVEVSTMGMIMMLEQRAMKRRVWLAMERQWVVLLHFCWETEVARSMTQKRSRRAVTLNLAPIP